MENKLKNLFRDKITLNEQDQLFFDTAEEYYRVFNRRVPREMLPASITDDQILAAMQTCIQTREDKLLDILGAGFDPKVLY